MAERGILTPPRWRFYDGAKVYVDPDDLDSPRITAHLNGASAMGFREIYEVIA